MSYSKSDLFWQKRMYITFNLLLKSVRKKTFTAIKGILSLAAPLNLKQILPLNQTNHWTGLVSKPQTLHMYILMVMSPNLTRPNQSKPHQTKLYGGTSPHHSGGRGDTTETTTTGRLLHPRAPPPPQGGTHLRAPPPPPPPQGGTHRRCCTSASL